MGAEETGSPRASRKAAIDLITDENVGQSNLDSKQKRHRACILISKESLVEYACSHEAEKFHSDPGEPSGISLIDAPYTYVA